MSEESQAHSEKHLQEASEVTIFDSDAQVELQLGHVCNNRCVFCVSGQLTEQRLAKQIPVEPVLKAIEDGRARGSKRVTFLGGEPTTQRSFMPALRRAVELGYEEIVIFTNGVRTRKPEFIDKIMALGGNYEWRFSVQGATEESHDRVTLRPGSYQRITDGMRYVASLGEDVTINMCINEYSYRSVPNFPAICQEFDVRQLHIDQVRPNDAGARDDDYFRDILVLYSEMAPYLGKMLEGFEAIDPDYDVNLGNYPYCQLPEWAHKIHHDGQATLTYPADGLGNFCDPFDKYPAKRFDKFHPPQCDTCVFKGQCNGVFEKYAELFGTDEFQPVTLERLQELDTRGHFFVLYVEPRIRPFLEDPPPAPWRALEIFRNTRDRVIETRYLDKQDRLATLILTPPEGRGDAVDVHEPLLITSHFRASLLLDEGMDPDAVRALMEWAEERLSGDPEVEVSKPVDYGRLMLGFVDPERVSRGRVRVARLTRKVADQGEFGSWRHTATRPLDQGLGAVLSVGDGNGGHIELTLEVQSDPERPLVGIRYELGGDTTPDMARPILGELMDTLLG